MWKLINRIFGKKQRDTSCVESRDGVVVCGRQVIIQSRILYTPVKANTYKKFIVPVGGLSKMKAEQKISELIGEYNEEINWDDDSGEVSINGDANIPFNKDYWIPTKKQYNV